MHNRLFVLTNKEHADNSQEARQYVYRALMNDPLFCGEGSRFGSLVADWFVIGGRWSGEIPRALQGREGNEDRARPERDVYAPLGSEDDAALVSQEIWEKVLNRYEGEDYQLGDGGEGDGIMDLEFDQISAEGVVGQKWLVVVDYHS